jgi:uncharacterized protein
VPLPRHPLRLNVGFLLGQPIGSSRDFHFDFPELHLPPDVILQDFSGIARIGRTQQGLLVLSKFKATVSAQCVRCLIDFWQPLETDFSELYAFTDRSVSESGLIMPEDGHIDIEPLVREYMVLEIPISPVCKPDCKGLCPVCGEDLNQGTCEHQS